MTSNNFKFLMFSCLTIDEHSILEQYFSPEDERSTFKNVPMNLHSSVIQLLNTMPIQRKRIRYRGPRPKNLWMNDCTKAMAERFSVYIEE